MSVSSASLPPPASARPRVNALVDNRSTVLAAAMELFAERGYAGADLDELSRRCSVDPGTVRLLFGDKAGVFTALVRSCGRACGLLEPNVGHREQGRAGRVARAYLLQWESGSRREDLARLYRIALGDPEASALLRRCFADVLNRELAEALGPPEPAVRAALVGAHLSGVAIARHLTGVEPLASAPLSDVIAWITPALEFYLRGVPDAPRAATAAPAARTAPAGEGGSPP